MKRGIYAIGDIHGRTNLLGILLARIRTEGERRRTVFLGDLINRGPDRRVVLDMVTAHMARMATRASSSVTMTGFCANFCSTVSLQMDFNGGSVSSMPACGPGCRWPSRPPKI